MLDKEYTIGMKTLEDRGESIPGKSLGEIFDNCLNDPDRSNGIASRLKDEMGRGIFPMAIEMSEEEYGKRKPIYQHFDLETFQHNNGKDLTIIFSGADAEKMDRVNEAINEGLTLGKLYIYPVCFGYWF